MTDDLDKKTDDHLNALFSEEVAGIRPICHCGDYVDTHGHNSGHSPVVMKDADEPNWCSDANAVLPWLEKFGWMGTSGAKEGAAVKVLAGPQPHVFEVRANAPTFARAAVLALLRAKRATP